MNILEEKSVLINGREGFEWVYLTPSGLKATAVIFVSDSRGYVVGEYSQTTFYNSYKSTFDNILNSFFIKGKPKYNLI